MSSIFARKALLQKGWAENVRLRLRAGQIGAITENDSRNAYAATLERIGAGQ